VQRPSRDTPEIASLRLVCAHPCAQTVPRGPLHTNRSDERNVALRFSGVARTCGIARARDAPLLFLFLPFQTERQLARPARCGKKEEGDASFDAAKRLTMRVRTREGASATGMSPPQPTGMYLRRPLAGMHTRRQPLR